MAESSCEESTLGLKENAHAFRAPFRRTFLHRQKRRTMVSYIKSNHSSGASRSVPSDLSAVSTFSERPQLLLATLLSSVNQPSLIPAPSPPPPSPLLVRGLWLTPPSAKDVPDPVHPGTPPSPPPPRALNCGRCMVASVNFCRSSSCLDIILSMRRKCGGVSGACRD